MSEFAHLGEKVAWAKKERELIEEIGELEFELETVRIERIDLRGTIRRLEKELKMAKKRKRKNPCGPCRPRK